MNDCSERNRTKQIYGFDLLKLCCSIVVIFLHINPFGHDALFYAFLRAIARVGVPCFFIMAGYLFYRHISICTKYEKKVYFLHYLKDCSTFYYFG